MRLLVCHLRCLALAKVFVPLVFFHVFPLFFVLPLPFGLLFRCFSTGECTDDHGEPLASKLAQESLGPLDVLLFYFANSATLWDICIYLALHFGENSLEFSPNSYGFDRFSSKPVHADHARYGKIFELSYVASYMLVAMGIIAAKVIYGWMSNYPGSDSAALSGWRNLGLLRGDTEDFLSVHVSRARHPAQDFSLRRQNKENIKRKSPDPEPLESRNVFYIEILKRITNFTD